MLVLNEQEIIQGCKAHDRKVQAYLYKARYSDYLKICLRYAPTYEDAEQLLNDAFYKIFTRVGQYDNSGSFEGWMKRVLINTCLDGLKTAIKKNRDNVELDETHLDDTMPSNFSDVLQQINFKELVLLIQKLPAPYRAAFNLYVFEGYSHREIAEGLQVKEGTSHWYVNQAREWLKKKLSSQHVKVESYGKNGL